MNPADYGYFTLPGMEFELVNSGKVSYDTTDNVITFMLGIPSLPEAVELSTQ